MTKGHCLCGAVKFEGKGGPYMHACHCVDCRRWTGGPFMGVRFDGGFEITTPEAVNWYASSNWAERGSCKTCGTALFYRLKDTPHIIVTAGALDEPLPKLEIAEHIFSDSKPAYYDFSGDAPRITGAEVFARYQNAQGDQ